MKTNTALADDRDKLGTLLVAVVLVAAPHAFNLATAVMVFFGLLVVWRGAALYFKVKPPSTVVLFVLTLAGAGIVLGTYHRFWGQEPGSSLFIVGLGLKLMEIKSQRDAYLVVFLAFFVALTQYLFSQSIPMAGYTLAVVTLLVTAMIGLNSNSTFPLTARLKMAGMMVGQAIPLMVVLFIIFPRIQGPLWQLPDDSHTAKTGLSDQLSPGGVSHLALSQETAFRVDFDGELPPPKLRYWRGPVFWFSNGSRWNVSSENIIATGHQPKFNGRHYAYTVTLEPHNQRWAFALDLPDSVPDEFFETTDFQLITKQDVTERKQYRLSSGTVYHTGPISEREARKGLQLPKKISPRLTELANGWRTDNPEPKLVVMRALEYFRQEKFYYTLNPPALGSDPVDEFVFNTRKGFCEHYATAFVTLMRLAQIPARVVTGYQGGRWNSVGRFLEVKQADAHAWAEVWLAESGWTRVDPTAAVAPERIERGLDTESQAANGEIRFNLGEVGRGGRGWQFWGRARMFASSIDHGWDRWVLAYGPENQGRFLSWLGVLDWQVMAAWLAIVLTVLLGLATWLILPKRSRSIDPAQRLYQQFLAKTKTYGLIPHTGEGAQQFSDRIHQSAPQIADSAGQITRTYQKIRYEKCDNPTRNLNDLKILRRLIRRLPTR
jgi:transglutaminase-like putative cysteine protease